MTVVQTGTLEIWQNGVRIVNTPVYANSETAKDEPITIKFETIENELFVTLGYLDSQGKQRYVSSTVRAAGIVRLSQV